MVAHLRSTTCRGAPVIGSASSRRPVDETSVLHVWGQQTQGPMTRLGCDFPKLRRIALMTPFATFLSENGAHPMLAKLRSSRRLASYSIVPKKAPTLLKPSSRSSLIDRFN
jgi:hypothetical protein